MLCNVPSPHHQQGYAGQFTSRNGTKFLELFPVSHNPFPRGCDANVFQVRNTGSTESTVKITSGKEIRTHLGPDERSLPNRSFQDQSIYGQASIFTTSVTRVGGKYCEKGHRRRLLREFQ